MKKVLSSLNKQKGQSLVELGLVLMIILVLMAGVLDLGRLFYTYLSLYDSAEEGATYASQYPTYCKQITDRAKDAVKDVASNVNVNVYVTDQNNITTLGCQNGAVVNQSAISASCAGRDIKVTVTKPNFEIVTPFISAITGSTISLQAQAINKVLRPSCP